MDERARLLISDSQRTIICAEAARALRLNKGYFRVTFRLTSCISGCLDACEPFILLIILYPCLFRPEAPLMRNHELVGSLVRRTGNIRVRLSLRRREGDSAASCKTLL